VLTIALPTNTATPTDNPFPALMFSTTTFGSGTPNSSTPSIPNNLHTVLSTATVVCLSMNF